MLREASLSRGAKSTQNIARYSPRISGCALFHERSVLGNMTFGFWSGFGVEPGKKRKMQRGRTARIRGEIKRRADDSGHGRGGGGYHLNLFVSSFKSTCKPATQNMFLPLEQYEHSESCIMYPW